MKRCHIQTTWISPEGGARVADAAARYPGAWSDAIGEPDAAIIVGDQVVFVGLVEDATFAALSLDPAIIVLSSESAAGG